MINEFENKQVLLNWQYLNGIWEYRSVVLNRWVKATPTEVTAYIAKINGKVDEMEAKFDGLIEDFTEFEVAQEIKINTLRRHIRALLKELSEEGYNLKSMDDAREAINTIYGRDIDPYDDSKFED